MRAAACLLLLLACAGRTRADLVGYWQLQTSLDDSTSPASVLVRQVGSPKRTSDGVQFDGQRTGGLLYGTGAGDELSLTRDFTWWVRAAFGASVDRPFANHDTLISRWGRMGDYSALLRSDDRTGTLHLFLSPEGRTVVDFDSAYAVDRSATFHDLAVVVRGGRDVTLYVDGAKQCSLRYPVPPPIIHDPDGSRVDFAIGYNCDPAAAGDHESFNGAIRAVRVYDQPLSATEIRRLSDAAAAAASEPACTITVDLADRIGRVHPFLFGHFLEHFQDVVYGGVVAQANVGAPIEFNLGVIEALEALRPSVIRWPGGNFTSAYHWRWGAVPAEYRPTIYVEPVWKQTETNLFGTPEFIEFCRQCGATPLICVGVGRSPHTPTAEEAAGWVRYCNAREGSAAELRRAAGFAKPFDVRIWGLGNEVYGSWQVGYYRDPREYAQDIVRYASAMRAADPRLRFVVCGDSYKHDNRPWNRAMLTDEVVRVADWISYHSYTHLGSFGPELPYEAATQKLCTIEQDIVELAALNREVSARAGRSEALGLAVDEWNEYSWGGVQDNARAELYHLGHALFTAGFLNNLLRHCDAVSMANYSPTVNCRGLLHASGSDVLLRATYHVFALYQTTARGESVRADVQVPALDGCSAPVLDAVAVRQSTGELLLLVINRDRSRSLACAITLNGFDAARSSATLLTAPSLAAFNDRQHPRRVAPRDLTVALRGSSFTFEFQPRSLTVLRLHE
ncbi:MAG: hypothetical protein KKB50_15010 [Planctomycetes bacterium]|nr:hypothetical protein [Planctomycetota bacterium]